MLRIAHRLVMYFSRKEWPPGLHYDTATAQFLPGLCLGGTHIVVCDNVSEMIRAKTESGHDWRLADVPSTIPPWKSALYEYRDDETLYGALLDSRDTRLPQNSHLHPSMYRNGAQINGRENAVFAVGWYFFMVYRGRLEVFPGVMRQWLDEGGERLGSMLDGGFPESFDRHAAWIELHVSMANALMNCKNIKTVDSTEEDAPPAKWQRRMKTPKIRYSRIKIDGFTSEAKSQGGGIDGHNKAWHICRGNFATYTDAAPLFGKYTGRYWRPQHVRGDKKHGEVHSMHEIAPAAHL